MESFLQESFPIPFPSSCRFMDSDSPFIFHSFLWKSESRDLELGFLTTTAKTNDVILSIDGPHSESIGGQLHFHTFTPHSSIRTD